MHEVNFIRLLCLACVGSFIGCSTVGVPESELSEFASESVYIESLTGGNSLDIIAWKRVFPGELSAPIVVRIQQSDWVRLSGPPEVDSPFPRTYSDEYHVRVLVDVKGQQFEIVESASLSKDVAGIGKQAALERVAKRVRLKIYDIAYGEGLTR
jgi:hypothetical protein